MLGEAGSVFFAVILFFFKSLEQETICFTYAWRSAIAIAIAGGLRFGYFYHVLIKLHLCFRHQCNFLVCYFVLFVVS